MDKLKEQLDLLKVQTIPGTGVRLAGVNDPRSRAGRHATSKKALIAWYKRFGYDGIPEESDVARRNVTSIFEDEGKGRKDRFSRGFRAVYAAETSEVALSEMRYHSRVDFYRSGGDDEFQFTEFTIETLGNSADLIPLYKKHFGIGSSSDACWFIGDHMRYKTDTLIVKSVRSNGLNQVIYRKDPIKLVSLGRKYTIKVFVDKNGRRKTLLI